MRRTDAVEHLSDAVGWTPLVKLGASVPSLKCQVFAKAEFMNPTGSVKDRIARYLVEKALQDGDLQSGGTIVEASSGNTALGLGMMARRYGLNCKMVVRQQTSREKLDCLRALGVKLVLVDGTLPADHPESYNRKAHQVVADTPGAWFPDQHHNRANNEAHYASTGPEIWNQMKGRIDYFVAGIGTGGTISGVARYLKEQDPNIRVIAVDVEGSVFSSWFHEKEKTAPSGYLLEGLGDEEIIRCPEFELFDHMVQVSDAAAFAYTRVLARREGMLVGGSSGAALWGVHQIGRDLSSEARIVTILPDSGSRYLSTVYNDDWMREKGFDL